MYVINVVVRVGAWGVTFVVVGGVGGGGVAVCYRAVQARLLRARAGSAGIQHRRPPPKKASVLSRVFFFILSFLPFSVLVIFVADIR